MKNLLLLLLSITGSYVFSQSYVSKESKTFTYADQMPEFPGGEETMMKFIQNNIQYPKFEMDNEIQGRVVPVTFRLSSPAPAKK